MTSASTFCPCCLRKVIWTFWPTGRALRASPSTTKVCADLTVVAQGNDGLVRLSHVGFVEHNILHPATLHHVRRRRRARWARPPDLGRFNSNNAVAPRMPDIASRISDMNRPSTVVREP